MHQKFFKKLISRIQCDFNTSTLINILYSSNNVYEKNINLTQVETTYSSTIIYDFKQNLANYR